MAWASSKSTSVNPLAEYVNNTIYSIDYIWLTKNARNVTSTCTLSIMCISGWWPHFSASNPTADTKSRHERKFFPINCLDSWSDEFTFQSGSNASC